MASREKKKKLQNEVDFGNMRGLGGWSVKVKNKCSETSPQNTLPSAPQFYSVPIEKWLELGILALLWGEQNQEDLARQLVRVVKRASCLKVLHKQAHKWTTSVSPWFLHRNTFSQPCLERKARTYISTQLYLALCIS